MKQHLKRNLTILTVVLFVAAAVYFNWSYNNRFGAPDAEMVMAEDAAMEADTAPEAEESAEPVADYFAEARLARQQNRDEATRMLQNTMETEGASQETIDSVMNAISAMAQQSMTETQIENVLLSKGYADCVATVTSDGVSVAVPAPEDGLTAEQVAAITDAVTADSGYTAAQLKVVEVKASGS
jgi:stage III sporulation protein AH